MPEDARIVVMPGIGEDLRRERERRGVSLDALSQETKVNSRHFYALENGDYHQLPSGVFRRGIARAYLQALSLDEHDWLPQFDASVEENARQLGIKTETDDEAWATFASNVQRNRMRQRERTGWRWLGVAVLLSLLLTAAWVVWHFELHQLLGER